MFRALTLSLLIFGFLSLAQATPGDVGCYGTTADNQEIAILIAYDQHGLPPAFLTLQVGDAPETKFNEVFKYDSNLASVEGKHTITYIEAFEGDARIKITLPSITQEESFQEGFLDFTLSETNKGQQIIIQCPY